MKIYNSIKSTIGSTPMVRLNKIIESNDLKADIVAKVEFFNPLGSVKDRPALYIIEDGERTGLINKDTTIIEATSGNTGIALAFICARKGYKLVLTMPESMSIERRKLLKHLGAELILTPAAEGMKGALKKVDELKSSIDNVFYANQFGNPSNVKSHRETTALEIWNDTEGDADILVSGVGTGGTITGVSQVLKEKKEGFTSIAVEPADSPVISGGQPGPHAIQGIGAGFIPDILDTSIIDETVTIKNDEAMEMARLLSKEEGILCGISSGAACAAAIKIAKREENAGKQIVVILPSTGERYISTALFLE